MIRPTVTIRLAALLLTAVAGCAAPPTGLDVSEARVRALIPGQDKTVGYFTVTNHDADDAVLVGASSPAARTVEMHVTTGEDGMMRMRRLQEVVIGAGETVRFEPGGRHLMLFGVTELGDGIDITLERRDGQRLTVRFEIIAVGET